MVACTAWPPSVRFDSRNEAIEPNEHQSVEIAESNSLRRLAPKHIDLLPEHQEFQLKSRFLCETSRRAQTTASRKHPPLGMSITRFTPLANRKGFPTRTAAIALGECQQNLDSSPSKRSWGTTSNLRYFFRPVACCHAVV